MSSAPLHKRKFDTSRFKARFFFDKVSKGCRNAAELSVTETVARDGTYEFANEFAVFIVYAFGNDSDTFVVLFSANRFNVFNEFIDVERNFGKIN